MKGLFFLIITIMISMLTAGACLGATHGKKVVCRVETEKSVLFAGPAQDVVIKVTLDAPPVPADIKRPRVNLSIVLDKSGSMGGEKIRYAKAAAIEALQRLSRDDIFSLVVYDAAVHTVVPAQRASNIDRIISRIQGINAAGSTALFGGVSQGASEIRKHIGSDYVHRIILLSDGRANVGPESPAELGRLGAALIKENISVTTIGVGYDYNEDLMTRLSQKSDGNSYFVETGSDLPRIFASELGDVLNVVAKDVKLEISVPDGVKPLAVIGRDGRITGGKVELSMNQLYGDQEKYALIKVRIPKSLAGTTMDIAKASVYYENPFNRKREMAQGRSRARFSRDPKLVKGSTNVNVIREYHRNLNAMDQEKAISLSDKGKNKEAVMTLKASAVRMKNIAREYNDTVLLKEAESMEKQAEVIERRGMDKKMRKVIRTRSYQMKNQQKAE